MEVWENRDNHTDNVKYTLKPTNKQAIRTKPEIKKTEKPKVEIEQKTITKEVVNKPKAKIETAKTQGKLTIFMPLISKMPSASASKSKGGSDKK
jgi:predicted ATP-dependent protease